MINGELGKEESALTLVFGTRALWRFKRSEILKKKKSSRESGTPVPLRSAPVLVWAHHQIVDSKSGAPAAYNWHLGATLQETL
ncbi:hypothetical protein TorRG33x02_175360 [Trema orientale]|uniref:Uncharacterized protein n=1 Tax=Trema orientale TaxID=63057 RepID=A0A2P5EMD1_TREOI|nr:hypothetical protein TorRG33x02_175360 [Trema orientale]